MLGLHLYFQHMGGKNTSHDCYKFKARLVYIVNSRPARAIQRDKNFREGEGRNYERGREGKGQQGRGQEGGEDREMGENQKESGVGYIPYSPNTQTQAGKSGLKVSLNYIVSFRSTWTTL